MADVMNLTISRPDKPDKTFPLVEGVYSVGSDSRNKLVLPDPSISYRHAVLSYSRDGMWIEDLGSETGVYVGGDRVRGRARVEEGAPVQVGTYVLRLHKGAVPPPSAAPGGNGSGKPAEGSPAPAPAPAPAAARPRATRDDEMTDTRRAEIDRRRQIKKQIHTELLDRLDLKRLTASRTNEAELRDRAGAVLGEIIQEVAPRLPREIPPAELRKEIFDEAVALGPLEDLLADETVTEIMVNGHSQVYVEREGIIYQTNKTFVDDASVQAVIERIVSPIGRRIDESQPYVDARLPDGSRVNAIIPPLSLIGPCITIRKFSKVPFKVDDMIRFGTLTRDSADFIAACVKLRKNIVVSGGTGSGKTSLLNVLSSYLPDTDRILTVEDAAELRLGQRHVVRLEARPPNLEGRGAITIRDLVRNALRMRPDRIVVGECRGGEALDMLQAMNTGHDGSLTTGHANSPRDMLSRLETMVLMAGMDLPVRAIREQIAAAVDVIVQQARMRDGSRKIVKVTEVQGMEGDVITMQDIFSFEQTGLDEAGRVQGRLRPTGIRPNFMDRFKGAGIELPAGLFAEPEDVLPGAIPAGNGEDGQHPEWHRLRRGAAG